MTGATLVGICTVTHDSAEHLEGYFAALSTLLAGAVRYELVLVDCASDDDSVARAESLSAALPFPARVVALRENRGFAGGINEALSLLPADAELALSLNPDARPEPSAIEELVRCHQDLHRNAFRVGAVTGRLVRPAGPGEPVRLDACGMRLRPTWRHFDRGSDALDRGQYDRREEVFGGTGAATLYRLAALRDCAVEGAMFDPDFHSFREDAELCFRLRERGWRVVYEPRARIEHRRRNLPRRRAQMSAAVNFHSLKNRYLLRILHETAISFLLTLPSLPRELGILGHVCWQERSSLEAFRWVWRNRSRLLARRRWLRARRTTSAWSVAAWFWRDAAPLHTEHRASVATLSLGR
ncbi:MAG TPA: glycosyltransferase [Thermoanaerobaculia bacterium]|nr:glycosyltransferase [Thermoanaerobaculia bacterium]